MFRSKLRTIHRSDPSFRISFRFQVGRQVTRRIGQNHEILLPDLEPFLPNLNRVSPGRERDVGKRNGSDELSVNPNLGVRSGGLYGDAPPLGRHALYSGSAHEL